MFNDGFAAYHVGRLQSDSPPFTSWSERNYWRKGWKTAEYMANTQMYGMKALFKRQMTMSSENDSAHVLTITENTTVDLDYVYKNGYIGFKRDDNYFKLEMYICPEYGIDLFNVRGEKIVWNDWP